MNSDLDSKKILFKNKSLLKELNKELNSTGQEIWKNSNGEIHREGDLPVIIDSDGSCRF